MRSYILLALALCIVRCDEILIENEVCKQEVKPKYVVCRSSDRESQLLPQLGKYLNSTDVYDEVQFSFKIYSLLPDYSFAGLSIKCININTNRIGLIGDRCFEQVDLLAEIQLSQNGLSDVRINNINTLIEIDLSANAIEQIKQETFYNLSSLEILNLASNNIKYVHPQAFATLTRLNILDLSDNKLDNITFHSDSLEGLLLTRNKFKILTYCECFTSLKRLLVDENQISRIDDSALSRSFPGLEILSLERNNLSDLFFSNQTFCGLTNLSSLSLKNNFIYQVNTDYLGCLRKVSFLALSSNFISDLDSLDLSQYELTTLALSTNNLIKLPDYFLSGQKSLNTVYLSQNAIKIIQFAAFSNITSNINVLQLDSNRISEIEDYAFSDLGSLTSMNLNNQLISNISKFTFAGLVSLTNLHLENNLIKEIKPETFSYLTSLTVLNLSFNNIANLSSNGESFKGLARLDSLDLNNNQIAVLLPQTFLEVPKLRKLYLNNNKLKGIETEAFKCLVSPFLYLEGNKIEFLKESTFSDITTRVKSIYLSNNGILSIERQTFSKVQFVEIIYLNNNNIFRLDWIDSFDSNNQVTALSLGHNLIRSIQGQTFKRLSYLEYLFLDHNQITSLPRDAFVGLTDLFELTLRGNFIKDIDMNCFSDLFNLRAVDLSNNPIEIIHQATKLPLPRLFVLSITSSSARFVNQFDLSQLTQLDISWNDLTSQVELGRIPYDSIDTIHLAGLKISSSLIANFSNNLKLLDVSWSSIDPSDIGQLVLQSPGLNHVNFSGLGLLNFDSCIDFFFYSEIQCIDMSYNRIKSIRKYHIEANTLLNYLYLSHNSIETIEPGAFSRNTLLKGLDLSFNRLKFISQDLFEANILKEFDNFLLFYNNDIQSVELKIDSLTGGLVDINLSVNKIEVFPSITGRITEICADLVLFKNRLSKLGPNGLANYLSLENLDISENKLSEIDPVAFKYTNVMLDLNLAFNNISELDQDVFSSMIKLKSLNISGNRLKEFTNKTFRDLVELETLDLSRNRIEQIAFNSFERLKELRYLSLYANSIKNVFDRRVLNGLISLKFLYAPSEAFINITTLAEMIEIFQPRVFKSSESTSVIYYESISIFSRYDLTIKPSLYGCFYSYYLLKNNIHLNLANDVYVNDFVTNCDEFIKMIKTNFEKSS